ncbi:MAG: hypothetical protein O6853_04235, partial [Actinobacteria bacterium]|nr:hypothetical protein [Actinomycetota bacterium]
LTTALPDAVKLLRRSPLILFAVMAAACSSLVGETPTNPAPRSVDTADTTTPIARDCVGVAEGSVAVDSGDAAGDALFLSGELFVCSDDVVVVGEVDLTEVAVGAQLAAAVEGPLLYPHPRLAAEIGRLKPVRVHLIGSVDVISPPDATVLHHGIGDAVDYTKTVLGVTEEMSLPAQPDASTIVKTVAAIRSRDHVVIPGTSSAPTEPGIPVLNTDEVVRGLAVPTTANSIWIVDAADPITILLAAATGRSVGATAIAIDAEDVLGYPEVGEAIAGHSADAIRFVGGAPAADPWQLTVLSNGRQVPGGGFYILPKDNPRRYLAFYGHPGIASLGVLGEQGPEATLERMKPFLDDYAGDGSHVVSTFEIIATVASAGDGDDGNYSTEWPASKFDDWIRAARENDAYVVLDLQPGRSDFLTQAKRYEDLLLFPFVGLALDPEWRLKPDQVHLRQIGSVDAAEINEVVHWLADLVRDNGLPQKMLMLHQFSDFMIRNRETLEERPEIQMIIQIDGNGTEPQKNRTYFNLTKEAADAHWSWGWKNFFDEDEPGPPSPESTMSKEPTPVYVSYQ